VLTKFYLLLHFFKHKLETKYLNSGEPLEISRWATCWTALT